MKRNISINISGIIFHVEEDGYELLRSYLDSITRYFSNYEDSKEITDDIESRIAEIFLKKLSTSKQVITQDDVEAVVATMGSVEDFAAQDYGDEEDYIGGKPQPGSAIFGEEPEEQRRLYRDIQRKILGGVAAGVAHYFRTDPLWVRLLLILFLFADAFTTLGVLSTITLITYIVFWIVVPGRPDLEQNEKIKKLFRNPDDKVLGGVASGLSAYFGIDPTVIRLLFVLTIFFGGAGLIIYIVLWLITPQAKTLTDKMQMKGEPVTLTNIEPSKKKNFSVSPTGEESTLLKAVRFPFRLGAVIFTNLGRALGPFLMFLGDAARVLFGLILVLIGGAVLISLLFTGGVTLGIATFQSYVVGLNIPMDVLRNSISGAGLIFAWIALLIPALGIVISGISVIARRRMLSTAVVWTAVGIWFVSLIGLAATVPPVIMDFREEARFTDTETLPIGEQTAILTLSSYADYDEPDLVDLRLVGFAGDTYELQKTFEARGSSRNRAIENARMVSYVVAVEDSVVSFPPVVTFEEGAKFRGQELDMTLNIPYNRPFQIDRDLTDILTNTLYRYGFRSSDLPGNTFMFTANGLECISCPKRENNNLSESSSENSSRNSSESSANSFYEGSEEDNIAIDSVDSYETESGEAAYLLDFEEFEEIEVRGPFRVSISQQNNHRVEVQPGELPMDRMKANVTNQRLVLYYNGSYGRSGEAYNVAIEMPRLNRATLKGPVKARISSFPQQSMALDLSGSSTVEAELGGDSVTVNLTGDSRAELNGNSQYLKADLGGAALLDARSLQVDRAKVDIRAASEARVAVDSQLKAQISGAGRVEYQGDAEVEVNDSGRSKLKKVSDDSE